MFDAASGPDADDVSARIQGVAFLGGCIALGGSCVLGTAAIVINLLCGC